MPHDMIDEGFGLVCRLRGAITLDEIRATNEQGWEHPSREKHFYHIWDFRDVDALVIDKNDTVVMASIENVAVRSTRRRKTALLATDEQIIELCEKYIEGRRSAGSEIRLFADEAEARKWVSI